MWPELAAQLRRELKPPVAGFFASTPNAPVQGVLKGDVLELLCNNSFVVEVLEKPENKAFLTQKVSEILGRSISIRPLDKKARPKANSNLNDLLNFGRAHSDIVNIK
jgi:hypothetical protein